MAGSKLRATMMIVVFSALPLVALATPVAASHEDECAGGIDASHTGTDPTPLEVYAGCKGALYNSPGDSGKHADDFTDVYNIRVDGTGTAKLHFRLCNEAKVGLLFYDVYWDSDLVMGSRATGGALDPGVCSASDPVELTGEYKPGDWLIYLRTFEEYLPENKQLTYDLYAQPLWR